MCIGKPINLVGVFLSGTKTDDQRKWRRFTAFAASVAVLPKIDSSKLDYDKGTAIQMHDTQLLIRPTFGNLGEEPTGQSRRYALEGGESWRKMEAEMEAENGCLPRDPQPSLVVTSFTTQICRTFMRTSPCQFPISQIDLIGRLTP